MLSSLREDFSVCYADRHVLSKLLLAIPLRSAPLRRFFWKRSYQFLAATHRDPDWTFMNYGFEPSPGEERPELDPDDEPDRFCIQLYHHLAAQADIRGREVLEVSSGRGGGASYLHRCLGPRSTVGLDFSPNAVGLCRARHQVEGLSFRVGDAESLPFPDSSFDVVVNVEASHCYRSMSAFLGQVARVLRPGGRLLYTDFRCGEAVERLSRELARSPLTVTAERDITANVLQALRLDSARKRALIEQRAIPALRPAIEELAALEGSRVFASFQSGERIYRSFALRKP